MQKRSGHLLVSSMNEWMNGFSTGLLICHKYFLEYFLCVSHSTWDWRGKAVKNTEINKTRPYPPRIHSSTYLTGENIFRKTKTKTSKRTGIWRQDTWIPGKALSCMTCLLPVICLPWASIICAMEIIPTSWIPGGIPGGNRGCHGKHDKTQEQTLWEMSAV